MTSSRSTSPRQRRRELQALLDTTASPSSPFNLSNITESTDTTVYPPPTVPGNPDTKKRKLNNEDSVNGGHAHKATASNDVRNALYPNLMLANTHLTKVHNILKKECEQLADLVVSFLGFYVFRCSGGFRFRIKSSCGSTSPCPSKCETCAPRFVIQPTFS